VKQQLINRFGEHRVLEAPVKEGDIPLLVIDIELKSPVTVLVTNGLSEYKMPVPEKEVGNEYNELFFCLPSYWEWEDMSNPRMNWVFEWIQRLAKYVVENETWFGHGHTMPCGAEMVSLSETMKQNHFLLARPMWLENEMAPVQVDGHTVHFLAIIPIFPDEMDYKQGKGTFKLIQKLENKGINEKLDDFRRTALKSKWRLRR
jgi:hypothetical protein